MNDYAPTNLDAYGVLMDQQVSMRTQLAADTPPTALYTTANQLLTGIDMSGAGIIPGDKVIISVDTNGTSRNGTYTVDAWLNDKRGVLRVKEPIPAIAIATATVKVTNAGNTVTRVSATSCVLVTGAPTDPDALMFVDLGLHARGVQGHNVAAASVATSPGGAAFVDVPGYTSWTFTAPVKRNYTINVSCSFSTNNNNSTVSFQLVVGSTTYTNPECVWDIRNKTGHLRITMVFDDIPLDPVATVIKLQWKADVGGGNLLETDTDDFRRFRVVA